MPDPGPPITVTEGQLRKLTRLTRKMHEHFTFAKGKGKVATPADWKKAHDARKRVDDYFDSLIPPGG
jgi:cytochrome P450